MLTPMSDDESTRRQPGQMTVAIGRHEGPASTSPYPVSRLSAAHDLIDMAAEIQKADRLLGTVTGTKLKVIADQIRALQEQARVVLKRAQRDGDLHRAKCNFEKAAGKTYHLYRRDSGDTYFSMLAPNEWTLKQPQTFLGSYRLEVDMSWTPLDEVDHRDADDAAVTRLLEASKGETEVNR